MQAVGNISIKKTPKKKGNDILDVLIFFLLSAYIALFTLGKFVIEETPTDIYNTVTVLEKSVSYHIEQSMDLILFIPLAVIYIALFCLFIHLRYKKTGTRMKKTLLVLFIIGILCRGVSSFGFPYGNVTLDITSPFNNEIYAISYEGLSIESRFVSFFSDAFFMSYFLLAFNYLGTLSKKSDAILSFFLYLLIINAIALNFVSYITETNEVVNNIKILFGADGDFVETIVSYTTHKNVYGLFLMLACFACFLLIVKNPKFALIYFALMIYFCFTVVIIKSRLSLAITIVLLFLSLLVMAIFQFKRFRVNAIVSLVILGIIVLLLTIFLTVLSDTRIGKALSAILSVFTNTRTLLTRENLQDRALALLISPYFYLFGYSRFPYLYYFWQTGVAMSQEIVWFSHNGYIDVFCAYGGLGLAFILVLNAILLYYCIYMLFKKNYRGLVYLGIMGLVSIYGLAESRVLFGGLDGTEILFFPIYFIPLLREYHRTKGMKNYLKENREQELRGTLLRSI